MPVQMTVSAIVRVLRDKSAIGVDLPMHARSMPAGDFRSNRADLTSSR